MLLSHASHAHSFRAACLHPQITHSALGAKAVAHNKAAILIASDCALSLSTNQTNTANNVETQGSATMGITSAWNLMAVRKMVQINKQQADFLSFFSDIL